MRGTRMKTAWATLMVAGVLGADLLIGFRVYSKEVDEPAPLDAYESIALFTRVIEQVRRHYVDADKTDYRTLVHGALDGVMSALDEHSQFMEPESYSDMKDDTEGHFGGLGIVISVREGILTIVAPMEDTPGFKAGLQARDRILEIDEISTKGMTLPEAVRRMRGEPGTRVSLTVLQPASQQIRTVEVIRAVINVESVKDADVQDDGIAYVRVTQFAEPTAAELRRALDDLQTRGMRALVLDLRNNPGGLLSSAVDIGGLFLEAGRLIVYTQGRSERDRVSYRASGDSPYADLPLAILVNVGSASAAEIVAGALQDQRRAVLIGEPTFGKGSVQSVYPLDEGSALRLTTAKYYTPSERVIHGNGIEPDIAVSLPERDWQALRLLRADPDSPLAAEWIGSGDLPVDAPLERARDLLKGVLLFRDHGPIRAAAG
jgi:carboxyl-terminal processing protease